jgi:hypothetical protein
MCIILSREVFPVKVVPLPKNFNPDVRCGRCGAYNIPDNTICGRCGASLPLVYGEDGKPRIVTDDAARFSTLVGKSGRGGSLSDPLRGEGVRWLMRFGVILAALAAAFWIMSRGR